MEDAGNLLRLTHVTATAQGAISSNYGIVNISASPVLNFVTANASNGSNSYGIYNNDASFPVINNLNAAATSAISTYGMYNNFSSPTIKDSVLTGVTNSLFNFGSNPNVITTMLAGPLGGSQTFCFHNYDVSLEVVPGRGAGLVHPGFAGQPCLFSIFF